MKKNSPLSSIREIKADVFRNINTIGQALLSRFEVVSREDLDTQKNTITELSNQLKTAQEKLTSLEAQLEKIEKKD